VFYIKGKTSSAEQPLIAGWWSVWLGQRRSVICCFNA